ncbi:hypothetical protein BV22DRAFT_1197591 [Leucogyrophana mollusca]|uniref:Uncharacterized protein n=1 Tax=Leucogyrophana mollusca TaxID=85980 RepID=A0ACB8BB88_9AGAM|nr:hypothetical protein BV22DRAFT_1197591 [Leucogyrophana mollusca]
MMFFNQHVTALALLIAATAVAGDKCPPYSNPSGWDLKAYGTYNCGYLGPTPYGHYYGTLSKGGHYKCTPFPAGVSNKLNSFVFSTKDSSYALVLYSRTGCQGLLHSMRGGERRETNTTSTKGLGHNWESFEVPAIEGPKTTGMDPTRDRASKSALAQEAIDLMRHPNTDANVQAGIAALDEKAKGALTQAKNAGLKR